MHTLVAALIGLLAGAHVATWGMYKDAIHEGFTYAKYLRSITIGALIGIVIDATSSIDLSRASGIFVMFGLCYVVERGIVEVYKTFFRQEDQSKYFIPMQLHVLGRLVESRGLRAALGVAYAATVVAIAFGVHALQGRVGDGVPRWVVALAVGTIGGWISAFGGAWKDAPIEGFETFKFFRSPGISALYALLLAALTDNLLHIAFASLGYTIATIETYKTFFFPNKPRGKFAGKPIHFPELLTRRQRFVPLYASIWLAMIVTGALALIEVWS